MSNQHLSDLLDVCRAGLDALEVDYPVDQGLAGPTCGDGDSKDRHRLGRPPAPGNAKDAKPPAARELRTIATGG